MREIKIHPRQDQRPGAARRGKDGNESGQSLAELALTLPLLLLILLGGIEFSRVGLAAIEVVNAARAGSTYGQQSPSDLSGMQSAAVSDASDLAKWTNTTVSATATKVCSCSNGTSITCSTISSCSYPAHVNYSVQVQTQVSADPLFYVQGLPHTYTLYGYSTLRVSR